MILAGVAREDISPNKGEELGGYPHYPRNNEGVHDPLYAACLYLNDGKEEFAMVNLDLLFFSKKHTAYVREKVSELRNIKKENIMISCSHTHSGPWAAGRLDIESLEAGKEQNPEYVGMLRDKIINAIVTAKDNAFEAEIAVNTEVCGAESGVGGNREYKGGPHDPLVSVIAVRDMNKTIRGIFVNYTLHPTFMHEWNNYVSADYPGYLKIQLNEYEKDAVIGFAQGASGNQSSRYYRMGENFDEAERVGRIIGKAAYNAVKKAEWKSETDIKVADSTMELELREFGEEEVLEKRAAEYKAIYEDLYAKYGKSENRDEYYLWQNANLKTLGAEDQLGYVKMIKQGKKIELRDDEYPVELQAVKIGDTLILGMQGEVFVEYALYLKAVAGYKTVIFNELANGCLPGYLYTPQSIVTGGYETDTSMLAETFGIHMVENMMKTIEKTK